MTLATLFADPKNQGQWSDDEDARLESFVNEFGVCWALIAQKMGTRSADRTHRTSKTRMNGTESDIASLTRVLKALASLTGSEAGSQCLDRARGILPLFQGSDLSTLTAILAALAD